MDGVLVTRSYLQARKPLPAGRKGSKWGFLVSPAMVEALAVGTFLEMRLGPRP